MKLKEYIEKLQRIYEEEGDVSFYVSIDDEGNGFNMVTYDRSVVLLSDGEDKQHP